MWELILASKRERQRKRQNSQMAYNIRKSIQRSLTLGCVALRTRPHKAHESKQCCSTDSTNALDIKNLLYAVFALSDLNAHYYMYSHTLHIRTMKISVLWFVISNWTCKMKRCAKLIFFVPWLASANLHCSKNDATHSPPSIEILNANYDKKLLSNAHEVEPLHAFRGNTQNYT